MHDLSRGNSPADFTLTLLSSRIDGTFDELLVFAAQQLNGSGDYLKKWWELDRSQHHKIRRLQIYLDNGRKNSGRRTQFLKRIVEFSDWSGLEIRLVYYPPYHSKYNPIERCWSSLHEKGMPSYDILIMPKRPRGR